MILATLAKPNYAIVLQPALGILFLLLRGNLRIAPWRQIMLFVILPVVILLAQNQEVTCLPETLAGQAK
jgi:hypothetical protein